MLYNAEKCENMKYYVQQCSMTFKKSLILKKFWVFPNMKKPVPRAAAAYGRQLKKDNVKETMTSWNSIYNFPILPLYGLRF